ncbi:hypothetical protein U1Q18_021578 [Sarracenia purpurea var. burkii]
MLVLALQAALSICQRKASRYKTGGDQPTISSKNTFGRWIRDWFKDLSFWCKTKSSHEKQTLHGVDRTGRNSQHHLASFMVMWLSRFVFVGCPSDGVNPRVFLLATVLVSGLVVPLAPLFPGSLYWQLDSIKASLERSLGRYDVPTFLCIPFL